MPSSRVQAKVAGINLVFKSHFGILLRFVMLCFVDYFVLFIPVAFSGWIFSFISFFCYLCTSHFQIEFFNSDSKLA